MEPRRQRSALVLFTLALALAWTPPARAQTAPDATGSAAWKRSHLLTRAGDAFAAGKLSEAERLFQALIRLEPNHEMALMHLAAISKKRNERMRMLFYLQRVVASNPRSFDGNKELGCQLLGGGRAGDAVLPLTRASELRPTDLETWINLGDAQVLTGQKREAEATFRQALKLDAKNPQVLRRLGTTLFDLRLFAEAIQRLEEAAQSLPQDAEIPLALGHCHDAQGNFAKALTAYRKAVELKPAWATARLFLGNAWERVGDADAAKAAYQKAIELDPKSPLAHVHLGNVLRTGGQIEAARRAYQKALDLDAEHLWALTQMGFLELQQGNHAAAQKLLLRAYALAPNDLPVAVALGDLYALSGRLAEAEGYYRRVLGENPLHLEARIKLGDVLRRANDLPQALRHYTSATMLHGASAWAWISRGDCERQMGLTKEAEEHYREAMQRDPESTWAQRQLAFLLVDTKRTEEAKPLLLALEKSRGQEIDVRLALGHVARDAGDFKLAEGHYRLAVKGNGKHARAHLFLAEAVRAQGRLDEAVALLRSALALDETLLEGWVLLGDALWLQVRDAPGRKAVDPAVRAEALAAARRAYEKAMALDAKATWPMRQLGLLASELGDTERAEALLDGARTAFPEDVEIPLALGRILFARRELSAARELFEVAWSLAPDDPRPWVQLGHVRLAMGQTASAVRAFKEAARRNPTAGWSWLELAKAQREDDDLDGALVSVQRAVDTDPGLFEGWLFAGRVQALRGKPEEAVAAYRRALALRPKSGLAHRALASALLSRGRKGDLEEGVREIDAALPELDGEAYTHLTAGHLQTQLRASAPFEKSAPGRATRATASFRRAILLSPTPETRLSAAQGFYDLGQFETVRDVLHPLLEEEPRECARPEREWIPPAPRLGPAPPPEIAKETLARSYSLQGDSLAAQGRTGYEVRRTYYCALQLWPGFALANARLGFEYERAATLALAERYYVEAEQLDPDLEEPRTGLARIRKEGGYPFWKLRASAEAGFRHEPLTPERLATLARITGATDVPGRTALAAPPKRLWLLAGLGYFDAKLPLVPRIDAEYQHHWGFGSFLNDRLDFENAEGDQLAVRVSGLMPLAWIRGGEARYQAGYRFFTQHTPSRFENRHLVTLGARIVQLQIGTLSATVGYENGGYAPRGSTVLTDTGLQSGQLELRITSALPRWGMEGTLAYRGAAYWLSPSDRQTWTHELDGAVRFRNKGWYGGGDLRAGWMWDQLPQAGGLTASAPGVDLRAVAGWALDGYSWAGVRVGPTHAPGFTTLGTGVEAQYRLVIPALKATDTGILFRAAYEYRHLFELGRNDHLVTATVGFAR